MEKKLKERDYNMFIASVEYIYNNPDISVTQIPSHFLKFWAIPDFVKNPYFELSSIEVYVFAYILRLYKFDGELPDELFKTSLFSRLFYNFQIILATNLYSRSAKLRAEPFPLFHIHEYKSPAPTNVEEMIRLYERITETRICKG